MRIAQPILAFLMVLAIAPSANALEFLITDSNNNPLTSAAGANPLNLGDNPVQQTIKVWVTYNSTDQSTYNNAGGLLGGTVLMSFSNVRNPLESPVGAFIFGPYGTNPGFITNSNSQFTPGFTTAANSSQVQVTFNTGTNPGIQLPSNQFLLFTAVIAPGATINSQGTNVVVNNPSSGLFRYGSPSAPVSISPSPSPYNFTVVPEPATYVLGAVASGMLGGVGYYRRKKVAKKA